MDAIEFMKSLEARASQAEIKALGLTWERDHLLKLLGEANAAIKRRGGMSVYVPGVEVEL
jgi:hypothetical protein